MMEENRYYKDAEWVAKRIEKIHFVGKQHLHGQIKQLMLDYPTTIGVPIIERAEGNSEEVCLDILYVHSSRIKPCLKGNVIVINC